MNPDVVSIAAVAAALVVAVLRATTPILFAALGGLISDLAGCINVALEGLMLIAAFTGVIVSVQAAAWWPGLAPWTHPWIGALAGLAAALAVTALLAFFHLELGADLIVAGVAINILAAGATVFLLASFTGDKGSTASLHSPVLPSIHVPGLQGVPVLDTLLNGDTRRGHHILVYASFLAAVGCWALLSFTRFGTWLRAVGENPRAAMGAGIPVNRVRYAALLLSGALAGLGGLYLSMGYLSLFQADMTAGRGFLALAVVFLGARRPLGTTGAALLFGACAVAATRLGAMDIPTEFVFAFAPFVTICALVFAGHRRTAGRSAQASLKNIP